MSDCFMKDIRQHEGNSADRGNCQDIIRPASLNRVHWPPPPVVQYENAAAPQRVPPCGRDGIDEIVTATGLFLAGRFLKIARGAGLQDCGRHHTHDQYLSRDAMRQFVQSRILLRLSGPAAALVMLLNPPCQAQFQKFGLEGDTVFSLRRYGVKLYAGTQRGAFARSLISPDSAWRAIGLKGKRIRAIYPHDYPPIGYAVTAGILHPAGDTDSTLTFCTFFSDTAWAPTDTGMDRTRFRYVGSADGFPSLAICGETFVTTSTVLYRRGGPVWEPVLDLGVAKLNVVRTRVTGPNTGMVYVGGETGIFAPFIKYSTDKGTTWSDATLPYHGDDACYAFTFDPADTSRMYAGMEGSVLESTDRGRSWSTSGLSGTSFYFFALAADFITVYAGGAANTGPGRFGLYRSTDRGAQWLPVSITDSLGGILSLEMMPTAIPEVNALFVGTEGSGVLLYPGAPVSVPPPSILAGFVLEQSYPNPFNPKTVIGFSVPAATDVRLSVFDLLGREVAVLVNGKISPGRHQAEFDATALPSGVYFYRLRAGSFVETKKAVLIR